MTTKARDGGDEDEAFFPYLLSSFFTTAKQNNRALQIQCVLLCTARATDTSCESERSTAVGYISRYWTWNRLNESVVSHFRLTHIRYSQS